jgi:hypothetical protein
MDRCIFLFKTSQHCEGVEIDVPIRCNVRHLTGLGETYVLETLVKFLKPCPLPPFS